MSQVENKVEPMNRLFDNFRTYTNNQLSSIYEQITELERAVRLKNINEALFSQRITELKESMSALDTDIAKLKEQRSEQRNKSNEMLRQRGTLIQRELKDLATVINRLASRMNENALE